MTTTRIRVSEPRELLALLPFRLGFRPRDSAVVVGIRPPRGRIGLIARVDLPDLGDVVHGPLVAAGLVSHLLGDGAEQAVLVVYCDEARPEGVWSGQVRAATEHFLDAAEPLLGPVRVFGVDAERYFSLDCDDPRCCAQDGYPLEDLECTQIGAHMVVQGAFVADRREDLARVSPAASSARRNVARVAGRWSARGAAALRVDQGRGASGSSGDALAAWRLESLAAWRALVADVAAGRSPRPTVLGRLDVALGDVLVRDAVLMTFATEGDLPERTVTRPPAEVSAEMGRALSRILDPRVGIEPPDDLVPCWQRALELVIAHGSADRQAPPSTLLGLLAWWSGDGARSRTWLERAAHVQPGYRLAELVDAALEAGLPPGWVQRS